MTPTTVTVPAAELIPGDVLKVSNWATYRITGAPVKETAKLISYPVTGWNNEGEPIADIRSITRRKSTTLTVVRTADAVGDR